MPSLLIIDDEPVTLSALCQIFQELRFFVRTASSAAEGLEIFAQQRPDVVLLDLGLPDLSGLETFHRIHGIDARTPIIFMTGYGTTDTAIEAMKFGAYDYLVKPLDTAHLQELVTRAASISQLMRVPADQAAAETLPEFDLSYPLVGRSPAMQEVYKAIGRVAPKDLTVLILGENGTGKELVAQAIYHHSRRATGPFLAINCAAIPETLLESELFGHEKGAFTGADRTRIGKFEQCSGGTLFLDEIGDMTPLSQTKILRLLQEQRFERVGGGETIQTDVRLIAATNRNLEQLASAGQFRQDLYYRLSGITIKLPPLRERGDDLQLLVDQFIKRFNPELGTEVRQVAPEAMRALQHYDWPGNVRELQSVIRQTLLHATGPVLLPEFLPAFVRADRKAPEPAATSGLPGWEPLLHECLHAGSRDLYPKALAMMERELLTRVLNYTEGNQAQAAKILGMTRLSLRRKIRSLGITINHTAW